MMRVIFGLSAERGWRVRCFAVASLLQFLPSAHANDTTAYLTTGGLIFVKSDAVEMKSEVLTISMKQITVQYRFENRSNKDIFIHVAFPMPDIPYATDDFNFAIPTDDPRNILGFSTTIDGRAVTAKVEQKAIIKGVDRTDLLRKLGVPLAPSLGRKYDDIPQSVWSELIQRGLIRDSGNDRYIEPLWTLKTTYYWEQLFPAHKEVSINHVYTPSVGSVVPLPASEVMKFPGADRYCLDKGMQAALGGPNRMWEQHPVSYVLSTGANWAGSIKRFRLIIDKGSPDNVVSFCGSDVRKTGPTQFEMDVANFLPKGNFDVLFLTPAQ